MANSDDNAPPAASEKREEVDAVCLALDIVGFSKETADRQHEMVMRLWTVVRTALNKCGHEGPSCFLLSGDGVYICLTNPEDRYKVFPLAREIYAQLRKENFGVRMGIHFGTGIKITDMNGQPNLVGNVVNFTERVMAIGQRGHIIVSSDAYKHIVENRGELKILFKHPVKRSIKHGGMIEIYNFHGVGNDSFGNPVIPKKP